MTTQAWIYLIGFPFAVVIGATYCEYERQMSNDPKDKEATLASGFHGLLIGTFWPLVVVFVLFLGLCWVGSQAGSLILNRFYF